jgi:hypothetical protein
MTVGRVGMIGGARRRNGVVTITQNSGFVVMGFVPICGVTWQGRLTYEHSEFAKLPLFQTVT